MLQALLSISFCLNSYKSACQQATLCHMQCSIHQSTYNLSYWELHSQKKQLTPLYIII